MPEIETHQTGPSASIEARYDVIVIGGGSAGSLIAAGGPAINALIHIRSGFFRVPQYGWFVWPHTTVPQAHLDGKPLTVQQGKELGGGSSVNAMVYVRGQRPDYERLQQAGEIVLSSGALNSPKILMLSGIGPAVELAVTLYRPD